MQVECKECHRLLNLPDDKLPVGRPFCFNCPYCKTKNTVVIPSPGADPSAAPPPAASPGPESAGPPPLSPPASDIAYPAPSAPGQDPDEFSTSTLSQGGVDERPRALVVYDEEATADKLMSTLEGLGYQVTIALNLRDAARQLKFLNFRLLMIQADYFGSSLNGNHLLRAVQALDNHSRRGLLVVLISPELTTLDDLTAFGLSLDAVVNTADLESIDRVLMSIVARAKKFYALYWEVLAEHGMD